MARVLGSWFLLLLAAAAGAPAHATTWTTSNNVALGVTGGSIYCSTTTCQTSASGLTGSVIALSAYSTPTNSNPAVDGGNWIDAKIGIYAGSGIGVSNVLQAAETTAVPQMAIDNRGANDMLVVDFGSDNWDVSSFNVNWACTINADHNCSGPTVHVAAWVGGSGTIDFNSVAFSGEGSSATLPGFQKLSLSNNPGPAGVRQDSTSHVGRYLVITGDLGDYSSAFMVSGLSAVQMVTPPPNAVPAAGTVPLMLLGALALGAVLRRRRCSS